MSKRVASVAVLDFGKGDLLLDGEVVAPHHWIGGEPTLDLSNRHLAIISIELYADNVVVIGSNGTTRSPTAAAEGRAIVRKGLADVLAYLGETP